MNFIWTFEREALAKRLYITEGRSAEETARTIGGISRNAVIGVAHRRGWMKEARKTAAAPSHYRESQVTFTAEMDAELRRIATEGTTKANAARRMQVSPSRLSDRVAALGIDWTEPKARGAVIERKVVRPTIVQADKRAKEVFVDPGPADAIPLIGRRFGQCSFPVGTPDRPAEQLCCGHKVPEGATGSRVTYCGFHAAMAVQPTTREIRLPKEYREARQAPRPRPANEGGLWDMVA